MFNFQLQYLEHCQWHALKYKDTRTLEGFHLGLWHLSPLGTWVHVLAPELHVPEEALGGTLGVHLVVSVLCGPGLGFSFVGI